MAEFDRTYSLKKLQIALHQLDRAILLFLRDRDFICSITLAGASEEILGSYVKDIGKDPCVSTQAKLLQDVELPQLPVKEIAALHLNLARNALKHFNDKSEENMSFALETEAIAIIVRALDNMVKLQIAFSKAMNEFVQWVHENRPDISRNSGVVEIVRP